MLSQNSIHDSSIVFEQMFGRALFPNLHSEGSNTIVAFRLHSLWAILQPEKADVIGNEKKLRIGRIRRDE